MASEELIDEPSDYGALKPGTRLGRYELLVPIARGGMARVWAARLHGQRGFQKLVAIKTILPELARDPEFERMFLDEARIASGVHHPNVCEIYELGEEQRVLYLVMEWVSGDSFSRVLRASGRTEAIDPRVAARIVADACAGLHSAHELTDESGRPMGVVHRDLSPHNILLTADGVAKVADFGVAKALGQLHEQTSAGQLKGKIAYMSPEQISGSGIDRRSDVFSLGCVLYEATTGERPFKGDGDAQVMHAVLKGEAVPPSQIIRGYPKELEQIVLRAIAAQAITRFPSAERMRFALEEYLTRGPLVTQSNVAQVVRARLGEHLERRKERIRQASTAGDHGGFDPNAREQHPDGHRSGVKQARPMQATMPIGMPSPVAGTPPPPGAYTPSPYSPSPFSPSGVVGGPMGNPNSTVALAPEGARMPSVPPPLDATRVHDYSHSGISRPMITATGQHPPHAMAPPMQMPGYAPANEPPPPGGRQYALAIGIGIVFALMIGTGSFLIWKSQVARREHAAAVAQAPASASAIASAPKAAAASAEIAFTIAPAEARISVDGRELAPEVRVVARPSAGTTVPLVVHAPGFKDATILVDAFTVSPVLVTLEKSEVAVAPPAADPPSTDPAPDEAPAPAPKPTAKAPEPPKEDPAPVPRPVPKPVAKPKADPALPPNPF